MKTMILNLAKEKLKYSNIPVIGINEGKSESGCYYGSIIVGRKDFEYRIGYIFSLPDILVLTDSLDNIMNRYYDAIKKYENK